MDRKTHQRTKSVGEEANHRPNRPVNTLKKPLEKISSLRLFDRKNHNNNNNNNTPQNYRDSKEIEKIGRKKDIYLSEFSLESACSFNTPNQEGTILRSEHQQANIIKSLEYFPPQRITRHVKKLPERLKSPKKDKKKKKKKKDKKHKHREENKVSDTDQNETVEDESQNKIPLKDSTRFSSAANLTFDAQESKPPPKEEAPVNYCPTKRIQDSLIESTNSISSLPADDPPHERDELLFSHQESPILLTSNWEEIPPRNATKKSKKNKKSPLTSEPKSPPVELKSPSIEPKSPPVEPRSPSTEPRSPSTEPRSPSTEPRSPSTEPRSPLIESRKELMEKLTSSAGSLFRKPSFLQKKTVSTEKKAKIRSQESVRFQELETDPVEPDCNSSDESSFSCDSDSLSFLSEQLSETELPEVEDSENFNYPAELLKDEPEDLFIGAKPNGQSLPEEAPIPFIVADLEKLTKEDLIFRLVQSREREISLWEKIRDRENQFQTSKLKLVDVYKDDTPVEVKEPIVDPLPLLPTDPPRTRERTNTIESIYHLPASRSIELPAEKHSSSWTERLKARIISKETEQTLHEIKSLLIEEFSDYKKRKVDFILALGLLQTYYKAHPKRTEKTVKKLSTLQEGQYFMKLAAGAYGWPLLYGMSKEIGKLEKVKQITSGLQDSRSSHLLALLEHTGLSLSDIIEAKWKSENFDNGHIIALNHERKEIIVSFRGTMCIRDVLIDMTGRNEQFLNGLAHSGILLTSKRKKDLLWPILKNLLEKYPDYSIQVTGHSLGAGTGAIFTILLLIDNPNLPIHCYCYGPPCCLSRSIAHSFKSYITSFIRADDIVSHMSLGSLQLLKNSVDQILQQSLNNKERFFHLVNALDSLRSRAEFSKKLASFLGVEYEKAFILNNEVETSERLVPPGRIFHFFKQSPDDELYRCEKSSPSYFTEIKVSSTMYKDHFPLSYESCFSKSIAWFNDENTKKQ